MPLARCLADSGDNLRKIQITCKSEDRSDTFINALGRMTGQEISLEIPRRWRWRMGRCANLSQIARRICAKIAGKSVRASEERCAKLSQICREFESQFRTILCKCPFSNVPFSKVLISLPLLRLGGEEAGPQKTGAWVSRIPRTFGALQEASRKRAEYCFESNVSEKRAH